MQQRTVKDIISEATKTLRENGYSKRHVRDYVLLWRNFQIFCDERGYSLYSSSIKDEFVAKIQSKIPAPTQSTLARKLTFLKKLDFYATTGAWEKGKLNPRPDLTENFNEFIVAQEKLLEKYDYTECSRVTRNSHTYAMLKFLENEGLRSLSELDRSHILSYLMTLKGHARSTMRCEFSQIREILRNAYILEYTSEDLSKHVPTYNFGQPKSFVKIWTSAEITKILDVIDRSSPCGKRDAALIIIASELGMRSKEICSLKVSDFDWDNCCITFNQCKKGHPNALPLNEKVGSAVIDYLRVRPQTDSEYLFVSMNPPYERLKTFSTHFQRYVHRAEIEVPRDAHYGLHSHRASVVTRLLRANVSPDDIFSFVGHSDRESLSHYIRMDIEDLRECALSFENGELI